MQRLPFLSFWARYGRTSWDETFMAKALKRLPNISAQGPWVAGGMVRRHVMDLAQDSDVDLFFSSADQFGAFSAALVEKGAKKQYENEFNVTYDLPAHDKEPRIKVQLIRVQYFATLEDVLASFDFSLCQCGFDGTDFVFGDYTLFDLANRRLIPGRISYGVSSLRRMIKYTKQGYTVCSGGLATMLEQIANTPEIIRADIKYID